MNRSQSGFFLARFRLPTLDATGSADDRSRRSYMYDQACQQNGVRASSYILGVSSKLDSRLLRPLQDHADFVEVWNEAAVVSLARPARVLLEPHDVRAGRP